METRHLLFLLVIFGTVSHCVDWLLQNLLYEPSCPQTQRSCYLCLLRPFSVVLPFLSLPHHHTAFYILFTVRTLILTKFLKVHYFSLCICSLIGGACVWEQRPQPPPPGHTCFPSPFHSPPLRSCPAVFSNKTNNIILVLKEGKWGEGTKKKKKEFLSNGRHSSPFEWASCWKLVKWLKGQLTVTKKMRREVSRNTAYPGTLALSFWFNLHVI